MEDEKTKVTAQAPIEEPTEMSLPDNAFRELKEGEQYVPPMRPERNYPEVTPYSVTLGLIMPGEQQPDYLCYIHPDESKEHFVHTDH